MFRPLDTGGLDGRLAGGAETARCLVVRMGLVATWGLRGVDPLAWLAWVLCRRGTWRWPNALAVR